MALRAGSSRRSEEALTNDRRVIRIDRPALRQLAVEQLDTDHQQRGVGFGRTRARSARRNGGAAAVDGNGLGSWALPWQGWWPALIEFKARRQRRRRRRRSSSGSVGAGRLGDEENVVFAGNVVVSAKYSLWNFGPRVLLAQLKRPSNVYFLFIAVLQSIKEVSNTSGVPTILLPLMIVIICSAIKEALEDRERHRADSITNRRTVLTLTDDGEWEQTQWGELEVGDIVKVTSGETIPADLLMLHAEEENTDESTSDGQQQEQETDEKNTHRQRGLLAYIETKSLDGETNLKIRSAIPLISTLSASEPELVLMRGVVECEQPNNRINSFEGTYSIAIEQERAVALGVDAAATSGAAIAGNEHRSRNQLHETDPRIDVDTVSVRFPLTAKQMLLRSCVLRNTHSVTGMVIFTGHETKVFCSNTEPKVKVSSVEQRLNGLILGVVLIQQLVCAFGAILGAYWMVTHGETHWYLRMVGGQHAAPAWAHGAEGSVPLEELLKLHLRYFIIMQNFVPISLNVSLEFVKYWQAYFMEQDLEMYDEASDAPAMVRSSALNEDLGRVHHIFTDKTGTLTQNLMVFRYCMIGQKHYGGKLDPGCDDAQQERSPMDPFSFPSPPPSPPPSPTLVPSVSEPHLLVSSSEVHAKSQYVDFDPTDLHADWRGEGGQRLLIERFLRHLALCHSLIPTKSMAIMCDVNQSPEYSASSPDEQALVSAAAFCKVRFVHRTPETVTILEPGHARPVVYKLLHLLEFDSDRKRMSVIVESPEGEIELLCKGADNVILERLRTNAPTDASESDNIEEVYNQLSRYAQAGMRTLCLAARRIEREEYDRWHERFVAAHSSMEELVKKRQGLPNAIDPLMHEIERDLELLGATAVQDKLQDGVPQTLALLQQTNMKIWTLTGDKMETAINIGYACNQLNGGMCIQQVNSDDYISTAKILHELVARHSPSSIDSNDREHTSPRRESFSSPTGSHVTKYKKRHRRSRKRRTHEPSSWSPLSWVQSLGTIFGGEPPKLKRERGNRRSARRSSATRTGLSASSPSVAVNVYDSDEMVDVQDGGEENLDMDNEYGSLLPDSERDTDRSGRYRRSLSGRSATRHGIAQLPPLGLVIDGAALEFALRPRLRPLFYTLTKQSRSVICCRVSPKQKADVIEFIRHFEPDSITLAIGDGANDVGMIQAAHIGVGISGLEGTQAVNASDYAIAQFRFLQRLLFVHGRWAYRRVAKLMSYMLYKNVTYVLTTFWFGCYCGFSGQPLILDIAAQSFNVLYTSLPLVLFAVLDQDISSESAAQVPSLYALGQNNVLLKRRVFWPWILNGIWHSIVIFFMSTWGYDGKQPLMLDGHTDRQMMAAHVTIASDTGRDDGLVTLGFIVFTNLVIVVNLKLCLETFMVTWYFLLTVAGSILLWFFVGNLIASSHSGITQAIGEMPYLQRTPSFWVLCVLVISIALLRDVLWKVLRRITFPSTYHILQEREKLNMRNSPRSLRRGPRSPSTISTTPLLWSDVQATPIVEYAKMLRQNSPFENEQESFKRSSPLSERLMASNSNEPEITTGVRARGSFSVHGAIATSGIGTLTWPETIDGGADATEIVAALPRSSVGESGGVSSFGGATTIPSGQYEQTRRNSQYHGYAFSEDENVDSDVEAAATSRMSPRTLRKSYSGRSGSISGLFNAGLSTSAVVGDALSGTGGRRLKKMIKSVRGQKNA